MSHAAWLAARTPAAPERLATRVREVIAAHPSWERLTVAEAMVNASEYLLGAVLAERAGGARGAALDLLAADACVTWAFEAAADSPAGLGARAEEAMQRLSEAAR